MREDIYIQEIFYGISLPEKEEILKKSKDFVFMTNIKTTSIKDVFTGYVVKTKNGSNFKINDKAFFHRLKAGSAKFNCSIVYTSYKDCYSSLDDFEDTKPLTDVKLPLKFFIDKRIYNNEKKKKLDYVWIFALNRIEYYRDPKRMNGTPFGKDKAIQKVADQLKLDVSVLTNHYNARCQCVRWAKRDFNAQ